ncbi:hypothetical protein [Bradyrhizobium genosp. P]|uniref:hypothetical protein n=1 Tax=Bradyrhizobium genosp. P TaxID=83641 RepID=UPI003CEE9F14
MTSDALKSLDDWRRQEADLPGRPEAIRRLVEIGLGKSEQPTPVTPTAAASSERAKELAGKTADRLIDPAAPAEGKAVRKRRLIKGPSEFQAVRVDQPKKR